MLDWLSLREKCSNTEFFLDRTSLEFGLNTDLKKTPYMEIFHAVSRICLCMWTQHSSYKSNRDISLTAIKNSMILINPLYLKFKSVV